MKKKNLLFLTFLGLLTVGIGTCASVELLYVPETVFLAQENAVIWNAKITTSQPVHHLTFEIDAWFGDRPLSEVIKRFHLMIQWEGYEAQTYTADVESTMKFALATPIPRNTPATVVLFADLHDLFLSKYEGWILTVRLTDGVPGTPYTGPRVNVDDERIEVFLIEALDQEIPAGEHAYLLTALFEANTSVFLLQGWLVALETSLSAEISNGGLVIRDSEFCGNLEDIEEGDWGLHFVANCHELMGNAPYTFAFHWYTNYIPDVDDSIVFELTGVSAESLLTGAAVQGSFEYPIRSGVIRVYDPIE